MPKKPGIMKTHFKIYLAFVLGVFFALLSVRAEIGLTSAADYVVRMGRFWPVTPTSGWIGAAMCACLMVGVMIWIYHED